MWPFKKKSKKEKELYDIFYCNIHFTNGETIKITNIKYTTTDITAYKEFEHFSDWFNSEEDDPNYIWELNDREVLITPRNQISHIYLEKKTGEK